MRGESADHGASEAGALIPVITPKLITVVLTWFVAFLAAVWLLGRIRKGIRARLLLDRTRHWRQVDVVKWICEFGANTHSFMTLYPGFHYFTLHGKVLAFVDTPGAWVAGAEPACDAPPEQRVAAQAEALKAFAESAKNAGKRAIAIPVSESLAQVAQTVGFRSLQIGCEPVFELDVYDPHLDNVPTARQLKDRGARVEERTIQGLSLDERAAAQGILDAWLSGRPLPPFAFMNQVDPWAQGERKKYFLCYHENTMTGLLSAIPYRNGDGWYLVDVLRRKTSPVGTTELLILEAMRFLKASGAKEVSLGVAALSGLRNPSVGLRWIAEKGEILFRFKPLYQFKMKFRPTRTEPVFVLFSSARFGLIEIISVLNAFLSGGILVSLWAGAIRGIRRVNPNQFMGGLLRKGLVVRTGPTSFRGLLVQIKLTGTLLVLTTALYIMTSDRFGIIQRSIHRGWGFSAYVLLKHPTRLAPISAGFLHRDPTQFFVNMVTLILFVGSTEILLGSLWTGAIYFGGLLFANPLFYLLLVLPVRATGLFAFNKDFYLGDVGASLGIFACLGALAFLIKKGQRVAWLAALTVIGLAIADQDIWQLNHLFALGVGYTVIQILVR